MNDPTEAFGIHSKDARAREAGPIATHSILLIVGCVMRALRNHFRVLIGRIGDENQRSSTS
jgi:hypothetical protein